MKTLSRNFLILSDEKTTVFWFSLYNIVREVLSQVGIGISERDRKIKLHFLKVTNILKTLNPWNVYSNITSELDIKGFWLKLYKLVRFLVGALQIKS